MNKTKSFRLQSCKRAPNRQARLTLISTFNRAGEEKRLRQPLVHGYLLIGDLPLTLDNPWALGAIARMMLVQQIRLFDEDGNCLVDDIATNNVAGSEIDLSAAELEFVSLLQGGFENRIVLHLLPPGNSGGVYDAWRP
jgi:hypothetical protein